MDGDGGQDQRYHHVGDSSDAAGAAMMDNNRNNQDGGGGQLTLFQFSGALHPLLCSLNLNILILILRKQY